MDILQKVGAQKIFRLPGLKSGVGGSKLKSSNFLSTYIMVEEYLQIIQNCDLVVKYSCIVQKTFWSIDISIFFHWKFLFNRSLQY